MGNVVLRFFAAALLGFVVVVLAVAMFKAVAQ
jgi:hypothetical protein